MSYCAKSDPQANRLVYIMTTFNHVIVGRKPLGGAPTFADSEPVPNTPTGSNSNSSHDPVANFFLSHPPNAAPAGPTNASASTAFTPTPSQAHNSKGPVPPPLQRRDSGNLGGPLHSPTIMQSVLTPTTSATGDVMNDAEWFHFDTLWETWAPGTSGAPGVALFNESPLQNFDSEGGSVDRSSVAFALPDTPVDGRFSGGGAGGAMQMSLFPIMPFPD